MSTSGFVQRKLPEGAARFTRQQPSSTARLPQRELSSIARFAQQNPFSGSYHAWQDSLAMHDLRGLCSEKGPSLARCSPGVFLDSDLQGILNTWRAYLAKISSFWMHGGDILPGRGVLPSEASLGMHQGDILPECGPSSARDALRGCFIQRARLRLSEMSLENASSRLCRALARVAAPPAPRALPPPAPRASSPPPAPRVAGVGGDADRTEAEPFAAKRSETG